MQESKNKGTEIQKQKNISDDLQSKDLGQLQLQQPDLLPAEYDLNLEHEFDTTFAEDHHLSSNPNLLLSPNLASFLDSMHADYDLEHGFDTTFAEHLSTHVHTSSKDDLSAPFAQVSVPSSCCFLQMTDQLVFTRSPLNLLSYRTIRPLLKRRTHPNVTVGTPPVLSTRPQMIRACPALAVLSSLISIPGLWARHHSQGRITVHASSNKPSLFINWKTYDILLLRVPLSTLSSKGFTWLRAPGKV